MADDKNNIPKVDKVAEATELGSPDSDSVLTAKKATILEHEGQATIFEMGKLVLDSSEHFALSRLDGETTPQLLIHTDIDGLESKF